MGCVIPSTDHPICVIPGPEVRELRTRNYGPGITDHQFLDHRRWNSPGRATMEGACWPGKASLARVLSKERERERERSLRSFASPVLHGIRFHTVTVPGLVMNLPELFFG
jgi:hypothetical protein